MGQFQFGRCTFDASSRLLTCEGREVALRGKVAELLVLLLEHPNEVIGSEDLRERLWPEGFVETGNLAQQVYLLRKALAVDPTVAVDNVARSGYRLRASIPGDAPRRFEWSRSYLRSVMALVAAAFVLLVSGGASLERPRARPVDASVERTYELGRYFFDRRGADNLARARTYFERVAIAAPDSALGHAGLAEVWGVFADDEKLGSPQQIAYADRAVGEARTAVTLDPNSSTAHAALGLALIERGAPVSRGNAEYRRAIDLDPSNADAHEWYAIQLVYVGDLQGASRNFEAAAQVRPENVAITTWHAWIRYFLHDTDGAVADFRTALAINPAWDMAKLGLVTVLVESSRYSDALKAVHDLHSPTRSTERALRGLAAILDVRIGRPKEAARETRLLSDGTRGPADVDAFVVAAVALEGHRSEARRLRARLHLESKPIERRMIDLDPLVGPVFRDLGGNV